MTVTQRYRSVGLGAVDPIVEPVWAEAGAEELAATEQRDQVSIAFELGHRSGFDRGRDEGHAEGHRDGLAAGRALALAEGRERAAQLFDTLRAAAAEQGSTLGAQVDQMAAQATELGLGIAEVVLQRELATAQDPGADAIGRAVAALAHGGVGIATAVVRLHPDDVERLCADPADLLAGGELSVIADPGVEPGSCVLDADSIRVDTSTAAALDRVRQVLAP